MGVYDYVELTPPFDGFRCWRYAARWEVASRYGGFGATRTEYLHGQFPPEVVTEDDARKFAAEKLPGFSVGIADLEKLREQRRKLAKEKSVPIVDATGKRLSRSQRRAIQFGAGG